MATLKENTVGLFSDLPTWAKGVIAIAVTGTVIFVGYKVYKKVFKSDEEKDAEKRKQDELKFQKKEEKKESVKVNPTYKESEYIAYADTLFNELNSCFDSAPTVEKILMSMKNDLDVSKLITAYGKRQRTNCVGLDTGGVDGLLVSLRAKWVSGVGTGYNYFIKRVNNDWANKHITYRV